MYKIIFIVFLMALTSFAAGSDSCFNLLEYVPPAFNYHRLEIRPDFSIGGTTSSRENREERYSQDTVFSTENSDNANSNPHSGISADYGYYGWKGRTEWEIGSHISGLLGNQDYYPVTTTTAGSRDNSENQSYSSDGLRKGSASGEFSVSAAHYFRWPFFIGARISPNAGGEASRGHNMGKYYHSDYWNAPDTLPDGTGLYEYYSNASRGTNYTLGCNFNVRAGAGHIDDVSFAIAALNMLDRMAETEKSYKGCSAKHIQELAALIEKNRKRRILDSRIAFIENIDTLCNFIRESGIADEVSPRTVLELADQWEYAFHQERTKGLSVMAYPEVDYSRLFERTRRTKSECELYMAGPYDLKDNDDNDFRACVPSSRDDEFWNRKRHFNYKLNLLARYERPLSRFFQFSLRSESAAGINREWCRSGDTYQDSYVDEPGIREYSFAIPMISTFESISLAYYPNTRTAIRITGHAEYQREFDYYDMHETRFGADALPPERNYDNRHLWIFLNGDAVYYLSPRLQVRVSVGLDWSDTYESLYNNRSPWGYSYYSSSYQTSRESNSSRRLNYSLGAGVTWSVF